jgi:phosphomannomutase
MTRKFFGTDGIRGKVGVSPITPDFVMRPGYAAGKVLAQGNVSSDVKPAVLIGKDTRISGYMLEASLEAGFSAAGVDVMLAGPMPTPAVAYLTRALRLQAGVVISASHNPFDDNGIKFSLLQVTSCQMKSNWQSKRNWKKVCNVFRQTHWEKRTGYGMRTAVTLSSARAHFRRNSICVV